MPIYEYKCADCGTRLEKLIRNDGDIPTTCPACGSTELKKQFSSFSARTAPAPSPCAGGSCPAAAGGAPSPCCGSGGGCPL